MLIYKTILRLRHRAYDSGRKKSSRAAVPTLCVGNVTVGGTGKTPFTEMLLRFLTASHSEARLAVLSRGYKRKTKGFMEVDAVGTAEQYGDEPLQIARKFPTVKVAVDANRVEGCEKLKDYDLIVLDDAFQHRKLRPDFSIVLVDWSRPVFDDGLLPFGSLRDLPERIFAADLIAVSKCPVNLTDKEKSDFAHKLRLKSYNPDDCTAQTPDGKHIPVIFTHIEYENPVSVFPGGDHRYAYADNLILITGVARGGVLAKHLSESYRIVKTFDFPDHHAFSSRDLARIESAAKHFPTAALATTEKDAQRFLSLASVPERLKQRLLAVPIKMVTDSEKERSLLLELTGRLFDRSEDIQ